MSRIPAPFATFADICERAHPTNGNARALALMVRSDADLHMLTTCADAFSDEARAELGNALIATWAARGNLGEAACIARDPAFCEVISDESVRRSGARDMIAARRRRNVAAMVAMDVGADANGLDEIDRLAHWSEMPGGAR